MVTSATAKATNRMDGSMSAPNVMARLLPSWAYGPPVSADGHGHGEAGQAQDEPAAQDVAHVAQRQGIAGKHRDQERHYQVAREGHIGPTTNTQLASSGTRVSLRNNLARS